MSRPIIGLDIDGVLADFSRAYRVIAHEMYGVPVHGGGAQPTWQPYDLEDWQDAAVWRVIDRTEGAFWRGLDPIITPGEIADLNALAADGYGFAYVTARHDKVFLPTCDWLVRHGLPQGIVRHANDKRPVLRGLGGQLAGFLDDSPHGVERLSEAGLPVFVRDWPYNRHVVGVPRVASVGEYLNLALVAVAA